VLFAIVFVLPIHAQSAAEAAGLTSMSSTATAGAKPPAIPSLPATGAATSSGSSPAASSPHLIASTQPPAEETNRRILSENAGKNPSKLMLHSTAKSSQIWLNGKPVGKTPLLLVLAPGKYEIEGRGPHSEYAQQSVALLPRETREITLELQKRYPSRVTAH
jgi:hypothetical protein